MPRVAVCMVTYNAGKYLEEMLWSLERQTYKNFDVYVWNDGSDDRTIEVLKNFKDKLNLHIENHKAIHNIGTVKNLVVKMALKDSPDYIQMVDSDDALEPNFIEEMVDRINRENVDFVVCDGIAFGDSTFQIHNEDTNKERIKDVNPFISWGIFKADVIRKINYREGMKHLEDWDLYIRLIFADKTYSIIRKQLYNYRMHPGQFHRETDNDFFKHRKNLWEINNLE